MEDSGQLVVAVVAAIPDLEVQVDLARHPHRDRSGGNPFGCRAAVGHPTTLSESTSCQQPSQQVNVADEAPSVGMCSRPARSLKATSSTKRSAKVATRRCTARTTRIARWRSRFSTTVTATWAQVGRLRREFEFARRLEHPHIVTVYACGAGWLSMELVCGGGIANVDTMANRLAALEQIADALDYTHNRAIVHCDVKPANILVHAGFLPRRAHRLRRRTCDRRRHRPPPRPGRGVPAVFGAGVDHRPRPDGGDRRICAGMHHRRTDHRLPAVHGAHRIRTRSKRICTGRRHVDHAKSTGCQEYSTR